MNQLSNYIQTFGYLNPSQIDVIMSKATELFLPKDAYFSEAGKVASRVGFLFDGLLRVCYDNNNGEEITKYFIEENNMVVDLESYNNQIPSIAWVQAITDCRMIVFSRADWEALLQTVEGWDVIVHKIISKALLQKIERRSPLVSEDATTRYLQFLEKFPAIANRVPLSYLASYLGITQSSLSRIRKNIR